MKIETADSLQTATLPSIGLLVRLALVMSLGSAIGQGFGRFAYALLLVPMRHDLGWSYAAAGLMGSANALGYLAGALLVGPAVARWGARRTLRLSVLAASLSLIGAGLTHDFSLLLLCRAVNGLSAGLIFVGGAAIVMELDPANRSSQPLNIYYAGPGIGIALSGLLVPVALGALGWAWGTVWVGMGVIGLLVQLLIELALRRTPSAAGRGAVAVSGGLFVGADYLRLWPGLLSYALFGLGYIGYMTFAVAFLQSLSVDTVVVQGFWVVVGVAAALTGVTWGPLIQRVAPHIALVCLLAALSVGALLPVFVPQVWSFVLSGLLFGGSFLGFVSALTRQIRLALPPARWTTVTGNATALFAAGQLLGPTLTGLIADQQGGLATGLIGSAVVLVVAALVVVFGPKP
ncbi:MAG TPA: YbfB/YjiJ family MFS transporter [Roseiflexaceae bacterium]|nr:YbfB/YjiJ family MFS transporter [Roseiflexaceae bacterium]